MGRRGKDFIFQSVYLGEPVVPMGPLEGAEDEDWVRTPSPMAHGAGYSPVDSKDSINTILITVLYDMTMSAALHSCFPCQTVNLRRQVPCLSCCLLCPQHLKLCPPHNRCKTATDKITGNW